MHATSQEFSLGGDAFEFESLLPQRLQKQLKIYKMQVLGTFLGNMKKQRKYSSLDKF